MNKVEMTDYMTRLYMRGYRDGRINIANERDGVTITSKPEGMDMPDEIGAPNGD